MLLLENGSQHRINRVNRFTHVEVRPEVTRFQHWRQIDGYVCSFELISRRPVERHLDQFPITYSSSIETRRRTVERRELIYVEITLCENAFIFI